MAHEIGSNNYMNQLHAIIGRQDQTKLLTSIECPTLLLAGKNDKVIPIDCAQQMAMDIKNAELFYIEECGHMAMLEQPKIINQILSGWL